MTIREKIAKDIPVKAKVYRLVRMPNGKQKSKLVRAAVPDEVALGNQPPGPLVPLDSGRPRGKERAA